MGAEILNITTNPGLLAIKMNPAKIVKGYHTLTHYYDLGKITEQIRLLENNYNNNIQHVSNSSDPRTKILLNTVNYTLELIAKKFENLIVTPSSIRTKRGLINGLGSLVKYVTGNLDASDEEKYNDIIERLQNEQEDLQTQINSQYSINQSILKNFNRTVDTIAYNNQAITKEIKDIKNNAVALWSSKATNVLEHTQILLNLILSTLQDIENSLTFCKLGKLHPSIVDAHVLRNELSRLANFYDTRFLNYKNKDLFEIQSYIKVQCFIGIQEIVYFLDIPIVDPENFDLYYLVPLPTQLENSRYATIVPTHKYFLKTESNSKVITLRHNCLDGHLHLCHSHLISEEKETCEENFLRSGSIALCKYVQLDFPNNYVDLIAETNQYLLVFPHGDSIQIISRDGVEIRTLFGIHLAKPGNNHLLYHNQTLFAAHKELSGRPLLMNNVKLELQSSQLPDSEIKLKNLDLDSIQLPDAQPLPISTFVKLTTPSIWTMLLYLFITLFIGYVLVQYHQRNKNSRITTNQNP